MMTQSFSYLLTEFLGFWPGVWTSFWALSDVEKVTNTLAFLAPVSVLWGFAIRLILRSKTRDLEEVIAGLKQQNGALDSLTERSKKEVAERDAKIRELSFEIPSEARSRAEEERRCGNEERALAALRDNFETIRPELTRICVDLAIHHLNIALDFGDHHLHESKRQAELALLLTPEDPGASAVRIELLELGAANAHSLGTYDPSDALWDDARLFIRYDSDIDARDTYSALLSKSRDSLKNQNFEIAERILRRCVIISKKYLTKEEEVTATFPWLESLIKTGYHKFALDVFTDIKLYLNLGSRDWAVAEFYECLNASYLEDTYFPEILSRMNKNVERFRSFDGTGSVNYLYNRAVRAGISIKCGNFEDGIKEFEEVIDYKLKSGEFNEDDILFDRLNLAHALQSSGKTQEGWDAFQKLVDKTNQKSEGVRISVINKMIGI